MSLIESDEGLNWRTLTTHLGQDFCRKTSSSQTAASALPWVPTPAAAASLLQAAPMTSCCFFSVAQPCPTLFDPMDCSSPGFPVLHQPRSWLKLMSIELAMPSNHLILCRPLLLLPSIFPSISIFSCESALRVRRPKDWRFSLSISPSGDFLYEGLGLMYNGPCDPRVPSQSAPLPRHSPLWDAPEGQRWSEICLAGRTLNSANSAPRCSLRLLGDVARYTVRAQLTACGHVRSVVWLGRNMTRESVARRSGEEVCGQSYLHEQKIGRYLCSMRTLTKWWPQQKRILIVQGIDWPTVQIAGSLSLPASPVVAQWAHEQMAMVAGDRGCEQAQQHGLLLTKVNLVTATAESPICQQQRMTMRPPYSIIAWGDQPASWIITLDPFHHERGNVSFLLK